MDKIILLNQIEPGDIIKGKKSGWLILDHYITYLGQEHGFVTTTWTGGVRFYSFEESVALFKDFRTTEIKKFKGTNWEFQNLVKRALSQRGRSYSLLGFNCEHLANFIRTGKSFSSQVIIFILALVAIGIGYAFISNSKRRW